MPIEIIVPRLGWSMDEGTFAEWLKRDGEYVNAGDMIFVLEGEKASQEVESFDAGVLHIPADSPRPGETVVVGQLLGYLLGEGESPPSGRLPAANAEPPAEAAAPARRPSSRPSASLRPESPGGAARMTSTPRARRKARELGLAWTAARGTGRNGRIRERDVLELANPSRPGTVPGSQADLPGTLQPASAIRRTIAQRMMAGVHQTAPVTLTTKLNAKNLVACRQRLRSERAGGSIPSYTDLLVQLVAAALTECPALNACWRHDGVFLYDAVHIAIAVDTDQGLMAPVLRNAVSLSLDEIAEQTRSLTEQARTGRLTPDQLQGGTFTITNLGMFGIDFFTPIINLPQAAVLGVGRIADEPVIEDGQVVPGKTLGLSLTFDHRVIDGAPAARWLQRLAQMIERADDHV